ncbi:terminase small subunit [Streptococcus sp. E29BA]|uniref:terminase small subunit n=1 Tax=Streptococcus sp. E29BA TaxID=3278716 RepID=UPI00359E36EE
MDIREKKFVDEYIITGEEYTAAIKAGYAESTAKSDAYFWINPETKKNQDEKKRKKFKQESYDYYVKRMAELEKQKIAKADEVLQVFTAILRQELTEEVIQLDPTSRQFIKTQKKPSIAEVIKAGSELMKRYPLALETEKLGLEIEKLRAQVLGSDDEEAHMAEYFERLQEVLGDDEGEIHPETD